MADPAVPTELYYRLACSTFLVTGSRTTRANWDTGAEEITADSDVTLFVQADPQIDARIRLPEHVGRGSHDLSLKFAEDGRLLSGTGSAKGLLGEAIGAAASVISFVGGIAGAALSAGLPAAPPEGVARPKSPAEKWHEDKTKDSARLREAIMVLEDLHDAVIATGRSIAGEAPPAEAFRRLVALRAAIPAVEAEIAAIIARREAWYNADYAASVPLRLALPTHSIFRLAAPPAVPPRELDMGHLHLDDAPREARHVLEQVGLAIVEVTRSDERDELTDEDRVTIVSLMQDVERGELPLGIFFRVPRPAVIALYEKDGQVLRLESFERYWLVDRFSRMGSIPLDGSGDRTASITFTPTGRPETTAVAEQSLLGEALEALGKAPEQIAAGIGHAKTVVEDWGALSASRSERELRALERRKNQLEFDIARRGLEADAQHHETLQELKDRLERLKTEKDIGDFGAAPSVREQFDAERKKVLEELRTDVRIARAEAELASFAENGA
jgi:hypothetical protein